MVYECLILPFVEIEIRLGTINKNSFDSCIDRKYFEQIKKTLENGTWTLIENINTVEYISNQEVSLKLINNESIIMKENVITKNIQINNSPFDIRYSVNQEFTLNSYINSFSKINNIIRTKSRRSYISDNFKYDLTIVNEKKNNINKDKYEIEIELLVNKETLTWTNEYLNDFLECKIYDLINIVEPLERNKFNIKIL
jgi:hypothetical protein